MKNLSGQRDDSKIGGYILIISIGLILLSVIAFVITKQIDGLAGFGFFIMVGIIGFLLYWIPTLIAVSNNHKDVVGVFVLNFFVGWTFIGWLISLVWSVKNSNDENQYTQESFLVCPKCSISNSISSQFCNRCGNKFT